MALALHFFNVPGNVVLLILSLTTLSGLYFPFGFYFCSGKTIKEQNILLSLLGGMVLSIVPVGIVFKLFMWPGYQAQLTMVLVLIPALLLIVYFISRRPNPNLKTYYKNFLSRTVFWLVMGLLFYVVPATTLIRLEFSRQPELMQLKLKTLEHPGDPAYERDIENYHRQQDSLIMLQYRNN